MITHCVNLLQDGEAERRRELRGHDRRDVPAERSRTGGGGHSAEALSLCKRGVSDGRRRFLPAGSAAEFGSARHLCTERQTAAETDH